MENSYKMFFKYFIVFCLSCITIIFLCVVPENDKWFLIVFLFSKFIAFACGWLTYTLAVRWKLD